MSLQSLTYKNTLLRTKRGNSHGVFSNAKPIYLISIIDGIGEGILVGNKIPFDCNQLVEIYTNNFKIERDRGNALYRVNSKTTPYNLPFFHLNAEPYYHIRWKDGVLPPKQALSPSSRFLRENVDYAYLDNELWNLLQVPETRYDIKNALIKKFLQP